jgi:hypothetical protein
MWQFCTPPTNDTHPARARPGVGGVVAAALICVYALILAAPSAGTRATGTPLHSAVSSLATAIRVVEASYADVSLQITDRHLGLPTSARFCGRLTLRLPETGHARLACELRPTTGVHGTLVLLRSPQGAWQCRAEVSHPQLLPVACSTQPFK